MVEVFRFSFNEKKYAKPAFEIRRKVFVEEQNVDPDLEFDEYEAIATHYLLMFDGKPIGAARWRQTENGLKLERFAILKGYRNKKLGERLLDKVLDDVGNLNQNVYLHSQIKAIPFYERAGFAAVGDIFEEAGIQHYYMVLKKGLT